MQTARRGTKHQQQLSAIPNATVRPVFFPNHHSVQRLVSLTLQTSGVLRISCTVQRSLNAGAVELEHLPERASGRGALLISPNATHQSWTAQTALISQVLPKVQAATSTCTAQGMETPTWKALCSVRSTTDTCPVPKILAPQPKAVRTLLPSTVPALSQQPVSTHSSTSPYLCPFLLHPLAPRQMNSLLTL